MRVAFVLCVVVIGCSGEQFIGAPWQGSSGMASVSIQQPEDAGSFDGDPPLAQGGAGAGGLTSAGGDGGTGANPMMPATGGSSDGQSAAGAGGSDGVSPGGATGTNSAGAGGDALSGSGGSGGSVESGGDAGEGGEGGEGGSTPCTMRSWYADDDADSFGGLCPMIDSAPPIVGQLAESLGSGDFLLPMPAVWARSCRGEFPSQHIVQSNSSRAGNSERHRRTRRSVPLGIGNRRMIKLQGFCQRCQPTHLRPQVGQRGPNVGLFRFGEVAHAAFRKLGSMPSSCIS